MATNEKLEAIKQEVFRLVSENKVPEAVGKLMSLYKNSDGTYFDDLLLLSRQYKDLTDRQMSGLVDDEEANIEKNRVSHGLINIVNNLHTDPAIVKKFGLPGTVVPEKKSRRIPLWSWLIPLVAIGGVALFLILGRDGDKPSPPPVTEVPPQTETASQQPNTTPKADNRTTQPKPENPQPKSQETVPQEKEPDQSSTPNVSAHNSVGTAISLQLDQPVTHTLLSTKDIHYYTYRGTDGERIGLKLLNQTDTFIPQVTVFNDRGMRLQTSSVRQGGEDYSSWFRSQEGKTFQIVVANRNSAGGQYQLTLAYE